MVLELVAAAELHLFSLLQQTAAAQGEAYNLNLVAKADQEGEAVETHLAELAVKVIPQQNLHLLLLHKVMMEAQQLMLVVAAAAQTAAEVMVVKVVVTAVVVVLHL